MQSAHSDEQECAAFTRYLIACEPDAYVRKKYAQVHDIALRAATPNLPVDAALMRFARGGPLRTRIADAYARIFRPGCELRRKLILTVAILENTPAFHTRFTAGGRGNRTGALWRIALSIAAFTLALTASLIVFGPRYGLGRSR